MSYQPESPRPRPTATEVWEQSAVRWFRREFALDLGHLAEPDRRCIFGRLSDLQVKGVRIQDALAGLEPFVMSFLDRAARHRAAERVREMREARRRRAGPSGA